jgi:hypothetical protein
MAGAGSDRATQRSPLPGQSARSRFSYARRVVSDALRREKARRPVGPKALVVGTFGPIGRSS